MLEGHRRSSPGDLVLIVADRADRVAVALDGLRPHSWAPVRTDPQGEWAVPAGLTEPPLFDWSDEDRTWAAQHHPFTSPLDVDDLAPATAKARAYDIVLNGFELGSGSIRPRPTCKRKVFEEVGAHAR